MPVSDHVHTAGPAENADWLPWLLQVADSQFPSGGYAHSFGLEGLVADGRVRDADGLEEFLCRHLVPGLARLELPLMERARAACRTGDLDALAALDREWDAWRPAEELRRASRQIGERRLALVAKLDPDPFVQTCATAKVPAHHLSVLALELRHAPPAVARAVCVYQSVSGAAFAAMKLLRMGPERGQRVIRASMTAFGACPVTDEPAGWFNPALDIASLRHARATERMFIS